MAAPTLVNPNKLKFTFLKKHWSNKNYKNPIDNHATI